MVHCVLIEESGKNQEFDQELIENIQNRAKKESYCILADPVKNTPSQEQVCSIRINCSCSQRSRDLQYSGWYFRQAFKLTLNPDVICFKFNNC